MRLNGDDEIETTQGIIKWYDLIFLASLTPVCSLPSSSIRARVFRFTDEVSEHISVLRSICRAITTHALFASRILVISLLGGRKFQSSYTPSVRGNYSLCVIVTAEDFIGLSMFV
jgi:hypothetical protein